jgi:hypothetical protein
MFVRHCSLTVALAFDALLRRAKKNSGLVGQEHLLVYYHYFAYRKDGMGILKLHLSQKNMNVF